MKPLVYPFGALRLVPTFRCNFNCDFCTCTALQPEICNIKQFFKEEVSPDLWVERIRTLVPVRPKITAIFCARESALYEGFSDIVNALDLSYIESRVYTNASTASMKELRKIRPRADLWFYTSYHPAKIGIHEFGENAKWIQSQFNVMDFHSVPIPGWEDRIKEDAITLYKKYNVRLNIQHPLMITKPGLLEWYGPLAKMRKFRGRFASRVEGVPLRTVLCKTSFNHTHTGIAGMTYPIAPNGDVYICWRNILSHSDRILGNFFDDDFEYKDEYNECSFYGDCNGCALDKNIIDKETGDQLDTDVIAWEKSQ